MCNTVIILIGLKLQRPTEQLPKSGETQYVKTGGKHRRRADVPWSITQIPMTGNNWKVSCDHSLHRSTELFRTFGQLHFCFVSFSFPQAQCGVCSVNSAADPREGSMLQKDLWMSHSESHYALRRCSVFFNEPGSPTEKNNQHGG